MSKCNCHVCWSNYPVIEFRRLRCGHCFCAGCIEKIQRMARRNAPACPECRAKIATEDPQVIYLDIVAAKPLESIVAEGIERMEHDSKSISVRTAARKLKQVADQERKDAAALESLLAAIDDFNKRIVPTFAKVKSQQTQIATLQKQLDGIEEIRSQAEKATSLCGEVAILRSDQLDLRKRLKEANRQHDLALSAAEDGKTQVLQLREHAQTLEANAQAEIRRLKGYLERNAEDRNAQNRKIRGLEQQVEDLTRKLQERSSVSYAEELEVEVRRYKIPSAAVLDQRLQDEDFTSEYSPHRTSVSARRSDVSSQWQEEESPLPELDFVGLPRPGFKTDWQLPVRGTKRKERDSGVPPGFPIALCRGRTTVAVQIGPKHTRRVKQR
ncbi:hypothetical protein B0H10DRAFT_1129855 [Mycena sp. CBHHK59/15]|nr:hypothetical protein B0H10DRAFT_1129855 [Mycena sp. CBHHK59/15]